MSERHVQRCIGITKEGRRCNRDTAKTAFCYQHLEKAQHVQIKKSTLPGAGMGLFTTIKRKKDDKLVPYAGKTVLSNDPNYGGAYVLQVKKNPPTFVDAASTTSSAGRFSNMAKRGQGGNNAKLSAWFRQDGAHASIKASKTIPKGKEILTNYGRDYWRKL